MTKNEEIQVVRDAAAKLGRNSYCGPWLESVADEVLAEMRSDYPPSPSIAAAQRQADEIIRGAKAHAEDLLKAARKMAEDIRNDNVRKLNADIDKAVYALQNLKLNR